MYGNNYTNQMPSADQIKHKLPFRLSLFSGLLSNISTVCPRSSDPFNIVPYYINWVTTSWTYSSISAVLQTTFIMMSFRVRLKKMFHNRKKIFGFLCKEKKMVTRLIVLVIKLFRFSMSVFLNTV